MVYQKTTKDTINFPEANLWFLTAIKDKLEKKDWNRISGKNEILVTISEDYPYCHDTVSLIQRFLSDKQWEFKMTKYSVEDGTSVVRNNVKWYTYTWNMSRRK